jgi:hypothetical protein
MGVTRDSGDQSHLVMVLPLYVTDLSPAKFMAKTKFIKQYL